MRRIFLLLFLLVNSSELFSQDSLLTLEQAIAISLKNNYDIKIVSNVSEQQANNNTLGNAGMLPNIDGTGLYTKSSNSLKQKYNTGAEVDRNASGSTNAVANAGATWTIFDGLKMFNTKEKLSELTMQSRDQVKIQIENSLQQVITAYYTIVKQQQLLKALREELIFSEERVTIAERKLNNGSGSRLEWLQTKTNYNGQKTAEITLETQSAAARTSLNKLLGRSIETSFSIEDTVIFTYKPSFDELKKSVTEQNNLLSYYRRNQQIAKLALNENKAMRWPIVALNANYVFSKNTNEAGFTLLNQIHGFNYGATATIPLFHGFNISQQIKNAKIDVLNSDISYQSANAGVNEELYDAWSEFSNNIELLKIEEQNIIFAREVLLISQERYRIGVSSIVEQQDAQRTFEDAMIRLANARFDAKVSETTLRRLNGELVK